jgi:pre-mRNA-splicing factor 38B
MAAASSAEGDGDDGAEEGEVRFEMTTSDGTTVTYVEPAYIEPTRARLERYGNKTTMNLPEPLYQAILTHPFFRQLYRLKAFHPVLHAMEKDLLSLTVYEPGSSVMPAKAMIYLFKLYTLKLTEKQISNIIRHPSNTRIRALGLLFLRLCVPPDQMVNWLWDYLPDTQVVVLGSRAAPLTIGAFCRKLLTHSKFEGQLLLPRLPPSLSREISIQLAAQFPSKKIQQKRTYQELTASQPPTPTLTRGPLPSASAHSHASKMPRIS